MRRPILLLALAGAAVLMSACGANLAGAPSAGREILQNLQGCERHYEGAIGAGVNGSFRIDCKGIPPGPAVVGPSGPPDPTRSAPGLVIVPVDPDEADVAEPAKTPAA